MILRRTDADTLFAPSPSRALFFAVATRASGGFAGSFVIDFVPVPLSTALATPSFDPSFLSSFHYPRMRAHFIAQVPKV